MEIKDYLNPDIELVDISGWDETQWLGYRSNGIGCSEIGTMLDMNEWNEPIILFNQKTGRIRSGVEDNEAMFMGRVLEDTVGALWSHATVDKQDWLSISECIKNGVKREYVKPQLYARNPKYKWLFGGCDGLFLHDGKLAVVEFKTISSFSANKYEGGIPPSYIFQCQAYMMLFDLNYCELAILEDGRKFNIYPIHRNESIISKITEVGEMFWNNVIKARIILSSEKSDKREKAYQELEPPVHAHNERAFNDFLSQRFTADDSKVLVAEAKHIDLVEHYLMLKDNLGILGDDQTETAGKIKYELGECTRMLIDGYKVTFLPNKNGVRTLRISKANT